MFSKVFQALTPAEMEKKLPEQMAYMACRFSPSGTGLCNRPRWLPTGSILLVEDSMQVDGHNPEQVTEELTHLVEQFSVRGVLLDFQGAWTEEAQAMATAIAVGVPCPVGLPEAYGKNLDCPIFLPPLPPDRPLKDYLAPWLERGVFLEIAPEGRTITLTKQGSKTEGLPLPGSIPLPLQDGRLHCHYDVEVLGDKVIFTLERTRDDLAALTEEAYRLGVLGVVGLYQELSRLYNF